MLRLMMVSLPLLVLGLAPATARTSCDTYGRCFEFVGANDRLDGGDADQLWRRADFVAPVVAPVAAPVEVIPVADGSATQATAQGPASSMAPDASEAPGGVLGDPLALAHGTMGEPLESLASDD